MKENFFTLYPAIDIKDGKCVRLLFGEMHKETIYNHNPLDQAMWFVDQGAEWLHIVDLDGAVSGKNVNKKAIENILFKLKNKIKIQIGGGIRSIDDIDFWIQNSANRVILGTLALENPNFINQLGEKYFKKIVIGADVRDRKIASHGWKNQSNVIATDLIKTLQGVNLDETLNFAKSVPHSVIASGGVASLNDISKLTKEFSNGVEGVIVGRALYDKKFTFSEALQVTREVKI